jgi:hypothetical protein
MIVKYRLKKKGDMNQQCFSENQFFTTLHLTFTEQLVWGTRKFHSKKGLNAKAALDMGCGLYKPLVWRCLQVFEGFDIDRNKIPNLIVKLGGET